MTIEELRELLREYLKTIGDSPWDFQRCDDREAIEKFLKWLEARL